MRQLSIISHENNENRKHSMDHINSDYDTTSKKKFSVKKQSSNDVTDFKCNISHVNDISKKNFKPSTSVTK